MTGANGCGACNDFFMLAEGPNVHMPPDDGSRERIVTGAVRAAKTHVHVVAGELRPDFYSGHRFCGALEEAHWNTPELNVNILANLGALTEGEAIQNLHIHNDKLLRLLKGIGNKNVYWAERPPRYHFMLADGFYLAEREHNPGSPREVWYTYKGGKLTGKYIRIFGDMTRDPLVHRLDLDGI
jgi:hypothetical protein